MDHNLYHEIEDKAQILVDSLPYIRDFNQKIIIMRKNRKLCVTLR